MAVRIGSAERRILRRSARRDLVERLLPVVIVVGSLFCVYEYVSLRRDMAADHTRDVARAPR
jgi:hypothetical protein